MIKVAQIITRLIQGGAQAHVLELCEFLKRDGRFEVTLIAGPPIGPEGELVTRARSLGIELLIVDSMRRAINPWRDWRAGRELRRLLGAWRPDIVHTHSAKAGVLGRRAAAALGVPKIFHTIHGMPFHPGQSVFVRELGAWFERRGARVSTKLICVGAAMRDAVTFWDIAPHEKIEVIPCGVDLSKFDARHVPRADLGLPDGFLVVTVSRLAVGKGHAELIDAATGMDARLVFVGDGELRGALEARAERRGVTLHVTGMVPPERVPSYLAAADVVAHPSFREGMPLALLEGALAQRPLVALDFDGAREIVRDGENGILCAPDELAASLRRMRSEHERFARAAREGVGDLRLRYDKEKTLARVAHLYVL